MASAKQIAWRKKFAKLYGNKKKKGAIDPNRYGSKKIKKAKSKKSKSSKSKSTTHKKTWKTNPHNPVDIRKEKMEKKYYVVRNSMGYATVHRRKDDKEIYYIPNLEEFSTSLEIDRDDDGMILFMLDSGGELKLL